MKNAFTAWDRHLQILGGEMKQVHQGFCIKFENGYEFSVTWKTNCTLLRSTGERVAEICIFPPGDLNSETYTFSSPEQVAKMMFDVSQLER